MALAATAADAQIVIPDEIQRDAFFTIEARLDVGDDPEAIEYTLLWDYPQGFVEGKQIIEQCGGEKLLMVGPAGKHHIGLLAVGQRYVETVVLMPDPDNPTDLSLAKPQTIKLPAGKPVVQRFEDEFTIGDPPDPEPEPPGPDPPKPEPETGKRLVYIVRESEEDTPQLAGLFVALRAGQSATWLRNQGHKLTILDDDEGDGRGNRSPVLVKLDPALANVPLPALIITDTDGKVLAKATITPSTTADNVVEAITRTGG